jgi:hypothetical protein
MHNKSYRFPTLFTLNPQPYARKNGPDPAKKAAKLGPFFAKLGPIPKRGM